MTFDTVSVVGLGNMGQAMVKVFSSKDRTVHGWNRTEGRRKEVEDMKLQRVTVHPDLMDCIKAADLIIMNVLGDEDLRTANDVIMSIPASSWKGKTIVQFTSHDALSIREQEKLVSGMAGFLLGGAMLAAPQDVGTERAVFLLSAGRGAASEKMDHAESVIRDLGPVKTFRGDVGYAALVDFGLVETIFFGQAGNEICLKLLQKYGASQEVQKAYAEVMESTALAVAKDLYTGTSNAVTEGNDWESRGQTFSAGTMLATLRMHARFAEKMGLASENFMTQYLISLEKVKSIEHGSSQVTDVYDIQDQK